MHLIITMVKIRIVLFFRFLQLLCVKPELIELHYQLLLSAEDQPRIEFVVREWQREVAPSGDQHLQQVEFCLGEDAAAVALVFADREGALGYGRLYEFR